MSGSASGQPGRPDGTRLRLLFDARWIDRQQSGIGRYSQGLIRALADRDDVSLTLLVSDAHQGAGFAGVPVVRRCPPTDPREIGTGRSLDRSAFDVVFSPHFVFGWGGCDIPVVLSVLDLIPYQHPMDGRPMWRLFYSDRRWLRLLLRGASAVSTLSQAVRAELAADTSAPVFVVPGAPSALPQPSVYPPDGPPTLVYMGRYDEYKDVATLVRGMAHLPGHRLVLLGRTRPEQQAALEALVPEGGDVQFRGPVSDQEYADALAGATALVSASRAEGFGLPLVEAMAHGVAVVCARTPIFTEVAGPAATYFDPGDPAGFAAAAAAVTGDATRRLAQILAGFERARTYSWPASADALVRGLHACVAARR